MSSTNHTSNYGLSQFLGTDKPAWLVDYNGDMAAIDTQMKANADAASGAQTTANTADGKADTNATAISTLNTQINGDSGIAADVTTLQGSVNTITSLIGNGEPTTQDKTIIGAINEMNAILGDVDERKYTKEIRSNIVSVTGNGVKTFAELMDELNTAFSAYMANLDGLGVCIKELRTGVSGVPILRTDVFINKGEGRNIYVLYSEMSTNGTILEIYHCQHNLAGWRLVKSTLQDSTATVLVDVANSVVPDGTSIQIYADIIA